jgi:DNA-binding PadR family transcriptional regulator
MKERLDILTDLERSGAIEVVQVDSGKRKKTIYRKRRRTL